MEIIMNKKNIPFCIDIVFCVLLLPMMVVLLPVDKWLVNNSLFVLILIVWLYVVYFVNRFFNVPLLFSKKKAMWAIICFILTVVVTYLIGKLQFHVHRLPHRQAYVDPIFFLPKMRPREQGVWFMFLVVTCFSFAVGLLTELTKEMIARQSLEFEKNKAELALYKAQINPHFLFNTLNSLYGLVISGSEKSENAFVQFIDMLKYMYSNGDKDLIPLTEEIEYIHQYIELQKLRLNEHTILTFECNNIETSLNIVPMILITFIENAFKYGVSSHSDSFINISINVNDTVLRMCVRNKIIKYVDNRYGIGIANCRKRLDLLYADKYDLKIYSTNDVYNVELFLNLK